MTNPGGNAGLTEHETGDDEEERVMGPKATPILKPKLGLPGVTQLDNDKLEFELDDKLCKDAAAPCVL